MQNLEHSFHRKVTFRPRVWPQQQKKIFTREPWKAKARSSLDEIFVIPSLQTMLTLNLTKSIAPTNNEFHNQLDWYKTPEVASSDVSLLT